MSEEEKFNTPFANKSVEKIGEGAVSRVLKYDDNWVIKEVTQSGDVNTLRALRQNKEDYELLRTRLDKFIPETNFIRGSNTEGKPTNYIVQRRVNGMPIKKLGNKELKDPQVRSNLKLLLQQCLSMWKETGRLPDLLGNSMAVFLGPRYTPNILIEDQVNRKLSDLIDQVKQLGMTVEQYLLSKGLHR